MTRWLCIIVVPAVSADAFHGQKIKRAECRADGTMQLLYSDGSTRQQPKDALQVGCTGAAVAEDGASVGWSILEENCCTSYPVARSVAVLSRGRKRIFWADQMVWDWRFISGAQRLAILSGPVHGGVSEAILYDVRSGRRLATWNGSGKPPSWASAWKKQFDPA